MKVFWGLVVVLALAAGVLLLVRRPSAPSGGPAPAAPAGTPAPAPMSPSGDARGTPAPSSDAASVPPPMEPVVVPAPAPKAETPAAAVPVPTAPVAVETKPTPVAPVAPAGVPIPPEKAAEVAKLAAALGEALTNLGDPIPSTPVEHTPVAAAGGDAGGGDPAAPAKIVAQPDGSVLVDDRFTMRGTGTKDDPYVVTWELLLSARETYQPRLGKKIIPDRLKRLDGKWIRLGGYTAFPIMAQSADEMLVMLNQWDGCCIGVPPTPYDAVEVRLSRAAEGEERTRVSGTLKGILRVDPYLVKDWLVSLYLMDEGVLTAGQ
jgi:hypothetical protein